VILHAGLQCMIGNKTTLICYIPFNYKFVTGSIFFGLFLTAGAWPVLVDDFVDNMYRYKVLWCFCFCNHVNLVYTEIAVIASNSFCCLQIGSYPYVI
jgi:hypothetical protein